MQAKAEAERWEMRVNQLQEKYGKVDLEEYRRVEAQLKELQASMKDSVPRSELEKVPSSAVLCHVLCHGPVVQAGLVPQQSKQTDWTLSCLHQILLTVAHSTFSNVEAAVPGGLFLILLAPHLLGGPVPSHSLATAPTCPNRMLPCSSDQI